MEKKKQVWEEFLDYVRSDKYRCDEVGLFLFARMFHIQIGVIVNAVVWTCTQNKIYVSVTLFLVTKATVNLFS